MGSKSTFRKYSNMPWIKTAHSTEKVQENVKLQLIIEQAMKAQKREKYNITLPLNSVLDGLGGQRHALAALPQEKPGNHCTGGWVGPRSGLDSCGNSLSHWDSIPRPFSLWQVYADWAIPAQWTPQNTVTFETLIAANRSKYYLYFVM